MSQSESEAPQRPLPHVPFYSVEYPGYVLPTSASVAIENLGGQAKLDRVFRHATSKPMSLLELSLRPDNPFSHHITGEAVATNNIVFKITKRRRKNQSEGEYIVEAVGVTHRTVRFRTMADFQYQPNMNDKAVKLRNAMDEMNVEALRAYKFSGELADYVRPVSSDPCQSNIRLFPPPIFSRQTIPQGYNFRANVASVKSITLNEEAGEEKVRLINNMRWRGFGPVTIMFSDSQIPEKPPHAPDQGKDRIDQNLLKRLHTLFDQRPIWTRTSLLNQFQSMEAREIVNSKLLLPLVCYVFQDGPWRDTLIKMGYDPRANSAAHTYQRLYFRNANHPIARPSVTTRRQDRTSSVARPRGLEYAADNENERSRSHIFDGKNLTKETAAFQLCDIEDPMLQEMIEDPNSLQEECDVSDRCPDYRSRFTVTKERDGWYTTHAYERIKMVLRHKFFSLLQGHVATDEECHNLLAAADGSVKVATIRSQRQRVGKHNMAKGALRPEDAAVMRLRAALDRNAKSQYTMQSG
ncbi:hypothetical protein APHAL10511_008350 [Amanita phalloides]|nr:hypothetical protein APHAL10511_008350 [Amanita phalloides]